LTEEVVANATKKIKNQGKKEANKAFLGFKKARELVAAANKVLTFWLILCDHIPIIHRIAEKGRGIGSRDKEEGQKGIDC